MTLRVAFAIVAMTLAGSIGAALAQSADCQQLWVERNSIYKALGYCFKTARAIAYFGNAGCTYDNEADLNMTPDIRRRIAEITREERRRGCT
jgi:hypothetical protein